jgi:hypothetical protein
MYDNEMSAVDHIGGQCIQKQHCCQGAYCPLSTKRGQCIQKQHCCQGAYCPLSTKRGQCIQKQLCCQGAYCRYQQNVDSVYKNNITVMVHTVVINKTWTVYTKTTSP